MAMRLRLAKLGPLTLIQCKKHQHICLAKFRCTDRKVSIEGYGGKQPRSEKIVCANNGIRVIQDEYHLICICLL